jgi:hypothetical protein
MAYANELMWLKEHINELKRECAGKWIVIDLSKKHATALHNPLDEVVVVASSVQEAVLRIKELGLEHPFLQRIPDAKEGDLLL